jgi:hypothetical protein
MAKRVSAGWHVSASAGDHPRPALLGLNDTLLGVLSWLGSRDVARLRRVCRELRDCGESAAQAAAVVSLSDALVEAQHQRIGGEGALYVRLNKLFILTRPYPRAPLYQ